MNFSDQDAGTRSWGIPKYMESWRYINLNEEESFMATKRMTSTPTLNIYWIVGFTDGEGCFCVSFSKKGRSRLNLEVRPSFSVSQKTASRRVLDALLDHFGCGSIRLSKSDGTHKFEIRSLKPLVEVIIPFFKTYSLLTEKRKDFEAFIQVCEIIKSNRHKSKEGMIEIIELAAHMNPGGTRKYSREDLLATVNNAGNKGVSEPAMKAVLKVPPKILDELKV